MRLGGGRTTDPRGRETVERERQLDGFLRDAARDVERIRGALAGLEAGEATAWELVQTLAHDLATRSLALKLGVLNACARELEQLSDEHQKGAPLDTFFLQCVGAAIETLALEIERLKRA